MRERFGDYEHFLLAGCMDDYEVHPIEARKAYYSGYQWGMIKTRTLDQLILTPYANKSNEISSKSFQDRFRLVVFAENNLAPFTKEKLEEDWKTYTGGDEEFSDDAEAVSNDMLTKAFVSGYRGAVILAGKYDDCLWQPESFAYIVILSDLLALEKRREDARRASTRIAINRINDKYGHNDHKYSLREQIKVIADSGVEVDLKS